MRESCWRDRWRRSWVGLWCVATWASGRCWSSPSVWWCLCRLDWVLARKVHLSTWRPAAAMSSPISSQSTATTRPRNERSIRLFLLVIFSEAVNGCLWFHCLVLRGLVDGVVFWVTTCCCHRIELSTPRNQHNSIFFNMKMYNTK